MWMAMALHFCPLRSISLILLYFMALGSTIFQRSSLGGYIK